MNAAKQYLEQMVEMMKAHLGKHPARESWAYASMYDFILRNGREYIYEPLPKGIKRGRIKQCYCNAFRLAQDHPEYTYIEGIATGVIPCEHAWCVDKDGHVLDVTWSAATIRKYPPQYFGVPFDFGYVCKTVLARKYYGIIDNWQGKWPLVTGKDTDFLPKVKP